MCRKKGAVKNSILHYTILSIVVACFFSCKTSNNVVSGSFLSKRKYNKGWYADFSSKRVYAIPFENSIAEIPHSVKEEDINQVNNNEVQETASLQMPFPDAVTEKKKQGNSETHLQILNSQKDDKIYNNTKPEEEQPESEKKKTNPYALYSILSLLWTPFAYAILLLLKLLKANESFMSLVGAPLAASIYIAILAVILFGFIAFKKKKEHPGLYKNNGLAIPGIVLGAFLALASIAVVLYFLIWLDTLDALIIMFLAYAILPAVVIGFLFYDTFFKKEKTVKPLPNDEEKEKIKSKLIKRNRFALVLFLFGLLLALVLLLFPMFFLQALPKNMDYYLFLFACLLFLTGIFKYISTIHLKRQYKK